jgi:predicted nucleic acid-binding protein
MPRNYDIVISDTSCLILLDKIQSLDILNKLFSSIYTTQEVAFEFGKSLPNWIKIKSPKNKEYVNLLSLEVDSGEASAIALALEIGNSIVILDDFKARRLALKLEISFTGTLGILLRAKELGYIPSIRTILEKIQRTNFRFSEKLFLEILKEANELEN